MGFPTSYSYKEAEISNWFFLGIFFPIQIWKSDKNERHSPTLLTTGRAVKLLQDFDSAFVIINKLYCYCWIELMLYFLHTYCVCCHHHHRCCCCHLLLLLLRLLLSSSLSFWCVLFATNNPIVLLGERIIWLCVRCSTSEQISSVKKSAVFMWVMTHQQ